MFYSLSPCHTLKMSPPVLDSRSSTCLYLPCVQGGLSCSDTERVTEKMMGVITYVLVAACWLDIYMQCLKKRLPRTTKEERERYHWQSLTHVSSGYEGEWTHYTPHPIPSHIHPHRYSYIYGARINTNLKSFGGQDFIFLKFIFRYLERTWERG